MQTQQILERLVSNFNHHFFWLLNYSLLPHVTGAFDHINKRISELPHITNRRHLYGSVEWRYKGVPIGHMHGNRTVDILFPKEIQLRILSGGKATQNKYSRFGISIYICKSEDIDYTLGLLLESYQLVKQRNDK